MREGPACLAGPDRQRCPRQREGEALGEDKGGKCLGPDEGAAGRGEGGKASVGEKYCPGPPGRRLWCMAHPGTAGAQLT